MSDPTEVRDGLAELGPLNPPIPFERMHAAAQIIEQAGALEKIAVARAEMRAGRNQGGRPATVSDKTVLIILLLLALEYSPMHITRATALVRTRLGQDSLRYLDLVGFDCDSEKQVYHRLARAVQRLIEPCDPFAGPRRRRLTYAEWEKLLASRDPEDVEHKNELLHTIMNDLVYSSVATYHGGLLDHFEGNYAVDGTFVRSGGRRGTDNKNKRYVATEYDAGRYYRDSEDHTDKGLTPQQKKSSKNWWGTHRCCGREQHEPPVT